MRSIALSIALAVLSALALSSSVLAQTARPMSGWFTVGVTPVEQVCGPNALTIGFSGSGNATHLGRMTGVGSNCTELGLASGEVAIWDGIATYVAADGSSVTVAYHGTQHAPVAGVAIASTSNTVISGTGRFEGAEGQWDGVGTLDLTTGVFSGRFEGWIAY